MTTTTHPAAPLNPIESIIKGIGDDVAKVFAGEHSLASFSGQIVFRDGKFFLTSSESIGPVSLGSQSFEIDPAAAAHFISGGVGKAIGGIFGKR